MSTSAFIEIEPLISYPRTATAGKSYVMTVDLRQASMNSEWPYEAEEYTVHLMLDSEPLFASEPIGDPSVVLHRFGGTYGPATFLLTANEQEMQGNMRLTLVNDAGLPVDVIEIPEIRVNAEEQTGTTRSVRVTKERVVVPEVSQVVEEIESKRRFETDSKPRSKAPPGFRLLRTFNTGSRLGGRIVWAPDRKILAIPSQAQILDVETGRKLRSLKRERPVDELVGPVSFSPNGKLLAVDPREDGFEIYDTEHFKLLMKVTGQNFDVWSFAWSPDSKRLAIASDLNVKIWNVETGTLLREVKDLLIRNIAWSPVDNRRLALGTNDGVAVIDREISAVVHWFGGEPDFEEANPWVYKVCWSPDGNLLASGGAEQVVRLWDARTGNKVAVLEGYPGYQTPVTNLSFSSDGRLLAAATSWGPVKIWRCDTWECVAELDKHSTGVPVFAPVFHPTQPLLAGVDQERIYVWDVDVDEVLGSSRVAVPAAGTTYVYSTAKVVLLGDSGTGKSALANRLVSDEFIPTTATHGLHTWVWKRETTTENESTVTREIIIWDLAGQANYRLLHPLFLDGTSVAIIVFHGRDYADTGASIRFWNTMVREAQQQSSLPIKKILVAARLDITGAWGLPGRVPPQDLGFDAYCETSAMDGTGITELAETIERLIDWEQLPKITTPLVSKYVRDFVMRERESDTVMRAAGALYNAFLSSLTRADYELLLAASIGIRDLRPDFDMCIRSLESSGFLMRLDNYILLRPEIINNYASAIINAARTDPAERGSISEQLVLRARFDMPPDERINQTKHERLLIKAAIDLFARNDVMFRVRGEAETLLVFPSLITQENNKFENRDDASVRLHFRGLVENIWAKLCVKLYKNDPFGNTGIWRNAVSYVSGKGAICTVALRQISPEQGELSLFFDNITDAADKEAFENLVYDQLSSLAIDVNRQHNLVCLTCGEQFRDNFVQRLRERGDDWFSCPVCGARVTLRSTRSAPQKLKVYVSSPFAGLQEYRRTVFSVLRELGHETAFAEEPNTVQSRSFEWMRQAIEECDVYICLLAWYRGYVPDLKDGKSIVQVEYETARELNKTVLVFLRDPMADPSQYESSHELEHFRQQLASEKYCEYFTTPEDLAEKVKLTLTRQSW